MTRFTLAILAIAACGGAPDAPPPTAPVSGPSEGDDAAAPVPAPPPPAEPTAFEKDLAAAVDAVKLALEEHFVPAPDLDPVKAWTGDHITWAVKEKRPLTDAAFRALDTAARSATSDRERQRVFKEAGDFYKGVALEFEGYRAAMGKMMSRPSAAPKTYKIYWREARVYYGECAKLEGGLQQECASGVELSTAREAE